MASLLTIKERKARWKELEKLITTYNKRHRSDSFRLSLPNKELIFKGIVRVFYANAGNFLQSKCVAVDSQTSSAKIVEIVMEKLGFGTEDPTGYALYHVYADSKEERLIGDSECPLTFHIFYSEKDSSDLRLVLRKQPVLTTAQKRQSLVPAPPASTTPQARKSREWQRPKDEVVDYGICAIEAAFEDDMSLIVIQSDRVTEAAKDLVNLVALNGKPRFGMLVREHLWRFLGPKAAQIIVNVKQLVIMATETANRHCSQQLCLKFVTLHIDAITQTAKEVVFTAKSVAGLPGSVALSRDEAIQKLIVEVESLYLLVKQCKPVVYNTIITGHLALALPVWLGEETLQAEMTLTGSGTVSAALVFAVAAATIRLLEVTFEKDKKSFGDTAGCVITSAQLGVEIVQSSSEYSNLNRHPLKYRVADVRKLLKKSASDLSHNAKLAAGISPPPGSVSEMLLSSFGVLLSVVNYTMVAQCASLLHAISLSAWDLLRYPWVTALLESQNRDQEESVEVVASLSTVTDMMSQTDVNEEDIVISEAVTNGTSGFVSTDGDVPSITIDTVHRQNQNRDVGDSDECGTNDAILRRSSLGSILEVEEDEEEEEGEEEEDEKEEEEGKAIDGQRPEESQRRSESRQSSRRASAGDASLGVPDAQSAGRRGSVTSGRRPSTSSNRSAKRKMSSGSLGLRKGSEEPQDVIREEDVALTVREVKAASPGLTVKQLRDTIEVVVESEKSSNHKVPRNSPKIILGRVKSPLEESNGMSVGKLKHCLAVNKAIGKVVESLFFSINIKVTALEAALSKDEKRQYQRLCKFVCDAAKQISEGAMELNFMSQDFQDVRDLIDRQQTPLMLAIKEATAMAIYESGAWSQANVSSSFYSAIQRVKDLSYQMVAGALKVTSTQKQILDRQTKSGDSNSVQKNSRRHDSISRSKSWSQSDEKEDEGLVFFDQSTVNDGYLTLRRNAGDLPLVRGGTPMRLMDRLTYHKVVDTEYTDDFLLTFHAFTTPAKLLSSLATRYNVRAPEGLTSDEQTQLYADVVIPIRLRIANVIRCWMNRQFDDFKDQELSNKMESFLETMARSLPACAKQLKTQLKRQQLHGPEGPKPRPSTRTHSGTAIVKNFAADSTDQTPILAIDPNEVAKQLTVIEWDMFKNVKPRECVGLPWNYPESQQLAPNMLNLINRANNLSSWIIDIIVKGDTAEKRASVMTYFTRTARKCYEIKNFNALFTIMTALTSSAIRRMGLTWEALPTKTRALLGQLNRFISSADNYMNYRQELHQVNQQPCIPYLGVILSELTFIEEGNPTFLPGHPGVINFHKYRLYAKALRGIQRHQQVSYGIGVLKPVYQHLKDLDPAPDEKELLRRSAVAEPDL